MNASRNVMIRFLDNRMPKAQMPYLPTAQVMLECRAS